MAHAPSRGIGHVKLALQFLRGDAVARCGEQEYGVEPLVKRQMRAVHECACARINVVFAVLAEIRAITCQAVELPMRPALRAVNLGAAVTLHHYVVKARLVIGKLLLKIVESRHYFLLSPAYGD